MFGLDDVAGAMLGSSVLEGTLGFLGARQQNISAARSAREQMEFQERMSNTSYQRAVSDMKSAGLNPMLAYQKGGASTPGGAMAPVVNEASSAGGAMNTLQRIAEYKNMAAQTNKTNAEAAAVQMSLPKIMSDVRVAQANAWVVEQTIQEAITQKIAESDSAAYKSEKDLYEKQLSAERMQYIPKFVENEFKMHSAQAASAQLDADFMKAAFDPRLAEIKADAVLKAFEIPGAKNAAEAEDSWWKQNVSPYLGDVGKVVSSAAGLAAGAGVGKVLSSGARTLPELLKRAPKYENPTGPKPWSRK